MNRKLPDIALTKCRQCGQMPTEIVTVTTDRYIGPRGFHGADERQLAAFKNQPCGHLETEYHPVFWMSPQGNVTCRWFASNEVVTFEKYGPVVTVVDETWRWSE